MSPKADIDDLKIIGFVTSKIISGVGVVLFIPAIVCFFLKEWNPGLDLVLGGSISIIFGFLLMISCRTDKTPTWTQGLAAVGFSWILAMCLAAIPYYLGGVMGSYLDACFDVMSGFTTTGLFLMNDLDHVSYGLNFYRHILTYCGGQGIVVVALSFMAGGGSGMFKLYVGEGREEKLLPNVAQTSRAIWMISLSYLVIGTVFFSIVELFDGLSFWKSIYHGSCLFMGAWSTGGFTPQSQNIVYYHNYWIDAVSTVFSIIGSFNFALHYVIWNGQRKEILKNIEIRSFIATLSLSFIILMWGLIQAKTYPGFFMNFRKAFFIIVSGHTTTGTMSIYTRQFVKEWGPLSMMGVTVAMSIGASACSTGGGFKGLRVGIVCKSLLQEIRRYISPESSVIAQKFHHIRDIVLDNALVKNAMMIILLYMVTYFVGTIFGMYYGYSAIEAFFESVSAGSNTGLSCGITSPAMPNPLKIVYIIEMWIGRLEFVSVLTLFGVLINFCIPKNKKIN
ncbi:MAG: TrkH family potassium uptake protein [bacterium]|nr:TrkH family potassium uptake protein [bacterium]